MNINTNFSITDLAEYLSKPDYMRPFSRYREDLIDPIAAFTADEANRLIEIVRVSDPQYMTFNVWRLLIDLSWASSRLEGNTYTLLVTQVLIEYGQKAEKKPLEDVAMIINHKRSIEFMLSDGAITSECVRTLHKLLSNNAIAPESRHFLDPDKCGEIRSYTPMGLLLVERLIFHRKRKIGHRVTSTGSLIVLLNHPN